MEVIRMKKITLSSKEIKELQKDYHGSNQFQRLLGRLRKNLNPDTGEILLSDDDVDDILWFTSGWAPNIFQKKATKLFYRHVDELLELVEKFSIPRKHYRF